MGLWILCFIMTVTTAFAEVGKVAKLTGDNSAYLIRNKSKVEIKTNTMIEVGDEIMSGNSTLVVHLYPETQISLGKQTHLTLEQADLAVTKNQAKSFAVLKLSKGMIRAILPGVKNQEIEQRYETEGMTGVLSQGEFEMSLEESKNVNLEVLSSQVAISSPFIQSFVPEIVKAKEGLTFSWKEKAYVRRKPTPRFTDHAGFVNAKTIKKNWDKVKKKFKKA